MKKTYVVPGCPLAGVSVINPKTLFLAMAEVEELVPQDSAPQEPAPQEPVPQDFSSDAKAFARLCPDNELPSSFAPLHHSFAFESHKRSNLHYLDEVRGFLTSSTLRQNVS